jgi:uncharacterized RDD family membrane protein YckC
MALTFLKSLDSLAASLRAFTPAKIREWRRLIVAVCILLLVLIVSLVVLAMVCLHVVSELQRIGYGPWFFILWMKSLGGSR